MSISWSDVLSNMSLLGAAYLLALPVAWNREVKSRSAGLRTFPLVAMASCAFMVVGLNVLEDPEAAARITQGIIGGIGFIGGGAILKNKNSVKGTATATSLWATGAIGVAVAWKQMEVAIMLSLATFFTLALLLPVKNRLEHDYEDDDGEDKNEHK